MPLPLEAQDYAHRYPEEATGTKHVRFLCNLQSSCLGRHRSGGTVNAFSPRLFKGTGSITVLALSAWTEKNSAKKARGSHRSQLG